VVGVPWVCPSSNSGQLRIETLEAGFERAMKRANVPANENATLHLIRHWFASKTYSDKSIPLPIAMKIVGHSSVATAMRYAHVGRDEIRRAADDAAQQRDKAIKAAADRRGRVVRLRGRMP
jgi:integrase